MLAVGGHGLDRAYSLAEGLADNGLGDPSGLAEMSEETIARRLGQSGYDRGAFMTGLMARRLSSVGRVAQEVGVGQFVSTLCGADAEAIKATLSRIEGVGPVVIRNFYALRSISK